MLKLAEKSHLLFLIISVCSKFLQLSIYLRFFLSFLVNAKLLTILLTLAVVKLVKKISG